MQAASIMVEIKEEILFDASLIGGKLSRLAWTLIRRVGAFESRSYVASKQISCKAEFSITRK